MERKFITYANAFTDEGLNQEIVLITASEDGPLGKPDPTWRRYHAQLLDALSNAKPKVVAFDLFFEDSSSADRDFGEAIRKATEAGTTVVIGARNFIMHEGVPSPVVTPALQSYLQERNWGLLEVGGVDKDSVAVRKIRLASEIDSKLPEWVEIPEPKIVPSFALQVMRAGLTSQAGSTFNQKRGGLIKLWDSGRIIRSIPVDDLMDFIVDEKDTAALDKISYPYHEVYRNLKDSEYLQRFFGGKIIIVGYLGKEDLRTISSGENRYGVQIQGNVISDLLQGNYISKLNHATNFLVIAVMSATGWLMGSRYRHLMRYKIPIELSVIKIQIDLPVLLFVISAAYLILTVLLYKYSRVLLAIPYHIVVLFLTFWLTDQIENRKKALTK